MNFRPSVILRKVLHAFERNYTLLFFWYYVGAAESELTGRSHGAAGHSAGIPATAPATVAASVAAIDDGASNDIADGNVGSTIRTVVANGLGAIAEATVRKASRKQAGEKEIEFADVSANKKRKTERVGGRDGTGSNDDDGDARTNKK